MAPWHPEMWKSIQNTSSLVVEIVVDNFQKANAHHKCKWFSTFVEKALPGGLLWGVIYARPTMPSSESPSSGWVLGSSSVCGRDLTSPI